jgi:WD40 repeat protein/energy-coupling factor transporter ATP-binding protein EcfA2
MSDDDGINESKVQADSNAIAIGGINIGGDVKGNIQIGHTTGYTSEQVSVLITQIQSTFQPKPFDGRCPYKGLDVFEEEDAELFFGREKLVDDLVSRVKDSRTVFVTGPSGSGKSSLVRAGLIHALKQGAIKGGDRWLYATMKPGRDPLESLATAFSRLKSPELGNYFRQHLDQVKVLHECAESTLTDNKNQRLVLFIDQFEEIFTQINKEEERVAFLNLLTHAAMIENGRIIILFSMRSDFVSNCATYPQLNALLNRQFVQIGAMQPVELVSAIAQPALRVGLRIDPDLTAQIINEMKGEPGALPLMQFALKDLFDSQQEKTGVPALTLNDYLQRGGIHKALERHADDAFSKLSKDEQELARSIFSGLIEIGRGTQDTKRTALFDELVPANTKAEDVEAIVQKLADARLITTDEQTGKDTVTISHEKLIDAWPWLKKLVNENRDVIALQNQIAADAKEWVEHKRDASYLYSGGRLASVREQVEKQKLTFNQLVQEFVRSGKAKQRRTQVFLTSAISAVLLASIVASVVFQNQAQANIEIANTAQAASTFAVAQQVTAQANAEEAQKQTNIALARQLAAQAQSISGTRDSKQLVADLLAIQSMNMFPSSEATQILLNSFFSVRPIFLLHHRSVVFSIAYSPDGKYVVTGSANDVRVWDISTGKEVANMTHDGTVVSVDFSPNGKYVASGSVDNTARVWEVASGKEVTRMTHGNWVWSVSFSPDSKYVISGSWDNTARVWEVTTGREVARMGHDGQVYSVAFSPDGKYVVSGGVDKTARVWETTTGTEVSRMTDDGIVNFAVFSPNGQYIVSGGNIARIWETTTGKEIARMTSGINPKSAAFGPGGIYVVTGNGDGTAIVWESNSGREIARTIHDSSVEAVAFNPNGRYVVSGSQDGTTRIWESSTGEEIARITHDDLVTSAVFSPDGKYVASGGYDRSVRIWEITTTIEKIPHTANGSLLVNNVVFSPDGKYVIKSKSYDNTVRVLEATTGNELIHFNHDGIVNSVVFSPNGKYVVSGSQDKTARVWDVATGQEVSRMTHDDVVNSVVFSPDGNYVVSASDDNTARIWEAETGREVTRMTHDHAVRSVDFSPDGRYIASASIDFTARVWEAATGKEIARMTHDQEVRVVAFSPDGKYVVSGSYDKTARVWEAATGNEISRMTHDGPVNSVIFSLDGHHVASGSTDTRVWETVTGKEIARIVDDNNGSPVAFSLDGKYVFSGDRAWTWQVDDVIANSCAKIPRNLTSAEWAQYIGDALPYQAVCPNLPIEAESTPAP